MLNDASPGSKHLELRSWPVFCILKLKKEETIRMGKKTSNWLQKPCPSWMPQQEAVLEAGASGWGRTGNKREDPQRPREPAGCHPSEQQIEPGLEPSTGIR